MFYKRIIVDENSKQHIANSAGEFTVMDLLTKCEISFDSEVSFHDLVGDKGFLRFDFCIHLGNDKNILVEVDGKQHKKKTRFTSSNLARYDKMKDDYCKSKGITLYRINYSSGNTKYVRSQLKSILLKEGVNWKITNKGLFEVNGVWRRVL